MDNLIWLNAADFALKPGKKYPLLTHKIPQMSFVLFYLENCEHCSDFLAIFKQLSSRLNFCRFAQIDLQKDKNMNVINMSKQTGPAEIKYVPFLVVYFDFKPIMIYEGPRTYPDIAEFLQEVYKRFESKNTSFERDVSIHQNGVIPYNVLICDKESCFIQGNKPTNINANNSCYVTLKETQEINHNARQKRSVHSTNNSNY